MYWLWYTFIWVHDFVLGQLQMSIYGKLAEIRDIFRYLGDGPPSNKVIIPYCNNINQACLSKI